jgi:transcriptional regulator with XRE-family HTH domain
MSLADLADASELSKGHLSSVEHGLAAITTQTITRLAKGLDVPPLYLLTFPSDDDRDQVVELLRKLPPRDLTKLRKELEKTVKAAAKATAAKAKTASKS